MRKFMTSLIFLGLMACTDIEDEKGLFYTPEQVKQTQDEKAQADFRKTSLVNEFKAAGILVDCELSICDNIPSFSLEVLQKYRPQFIQNNKRIKKILLTKNAYPTVDYHRAEASIPTGFSELMAADFFQAWDLIKDFEEQIGFRIELPNTPYGIAQVFPLIHILQDNKDLLKTESNRFEVLEINSFKNVFDPVRKVLLLRIDDLKSSFEELWWFAALLFKAQDVYGSLIFHLEKDDPADLILMGTLFDRAAQFQPLFRRLKLRDFFTSSSASYSYIPGFTIVYPETVVSISNQFNEKYLLEVFEDFARLIDLSNHLGQKIHHNDGEVDLEWHSFCLDKLDSIKNNIKAKKRFIRSLTLVSIDQDPTGASLFFQGELWLKCNQTVAEMKAVVDAIRADSTPSL